MIQKLSIRNFKSIRELDLSCRRVNVFIGEPNVGKTNILEAMALRCRGVLDHFKQAQRATVFADLHFDQDLANVIKVGFDDSPLSLRLEAEHVLGVFRQPNGAGHQAFRLTESLEVLPKTVDLLDGGRAQEARYYLFPLGQGEDAQEPESLRPPFGENMASLLYSSKEARQSASPFFEGSGFKLTVVQPERRLKVSKEVDDGLLVSLPYVAASETLRRMVFFHLALSTNRDQALVFDEPEAHAFPPYTKILAEKIAADDRGNQFFLTTHSPYMLTSLISKTPAADLNVVLCRMENFETKAYVMSDEQKVQLMEWGMSAFFNFDRLVDDES